MTVFQPAKVIMVWFQLIQNPSVTTKTSHVESYAEHTDQTKG
jgi:hypothetical protein